MISVFIRGILLGILNRFMRMDNTVLRLILCVFFVFMVLNEAIPQIVQPQRLEWELKDDDEHFTIISAQDLGLLMYRESRERGRRGMRNWEFSFVDTTLSTVWTQVYQIDFDYKMLGYAYRQGQAALLFRDGYTPKDDFVIITMDVASGDTLHHMVRSLVPMNTLTHFEVVGNAALVAGMINFRPTIVHYDFETGKSKVIPGIYKGESELLELKVDERTKTFNVLIAEKTFDKLFTVTLMSFDADGVLLQNTKLEPEKERSLIFAGSTPFKEEEIMVTGTYSHKRSHYSRGIFIAKVDELGNHDIAYYSYADLDNFFSYMPARREARVRRKIERKKINGKKAKFNYRMLVREVIEKDGNYVMIGEAFYPMYRNSSFYGFYDPFHYTRNSNFMGYKFTHAIVIGFDSEGKVLWDNSFEINDVESYDLAEVVKVGIEGDKVILLYLYEGVIRSKVIQNGEVLEGKSSDDIKLNSDTAKVSNTFDEYGGIDNWFDDCFYAYGIQRIRSKDAGYALGKKVFFINKVRYE